MPPYLLQTGVSTRVSHGVTTSVYSVILLQRALKTEIVFKVNSLFSELNP